MAQRPFTKSLHKVGDGLWAYIQPNGSWCWSNAGLIVDGDDLKDGDALESVTVQATIVAHERGPKLRIVKFKPKRGYKNRTGHRQNLTRIEITSLGSPGDDRSTPAAVSTEVSSGS